MREVLLQRASFYDSLGTLFATLLVDSEGMLYLDSGFGFDPSQTLAEDGGVFERHACARRQIGESCVYCISEKYEGSRWVVPAIQLLPDTKLPLVGRLGDANKFDNAVSRLINDDSSHV